MNEDHSIQCPLCLAEYSRNDAPHEYARVLHVVNPRAEPVLSIEDQVCAQLRGLGVKCSTGTGIVRVPMDNDVVWFFGPGQSTWEGYTYAFNEHWVCDVPANCTDVDRIVREIRNWLIRWNSNHPESKCQAHGGVA